VTLRLSANLPSVIDRGEKLLTNFHWGEELRTKFDWGAKPNLFFSVSDSVGMTSSEY
jgi:hypothetical protein